MGIDRDDKESRDSFGQNYEFFEPLWSCSCSRTRAAFAASDAGLFMQNLMLCAHSKGLGTCARAPSQSGRTRSGRSSR